MAAPRSFTLFIVLLLAGVDCGCRGQAPPEEEGQVPASVRAVTISKVSMGEWTGLLGTTEPLPGHSAKITAVVEGRVLTVLPDHKGAQVVEGQDVKEGWIIVRLDDRLVRVNGDKLRAALEELGEQKKQAEYALQLAALDVRRLKDLLADTRGTTNLPAVSSVEMDKAEVMHQDAKSKFQATTARLAAAQADLQAHQIQLQLLTLRVPIDGKLGIVQAVPGQTLSPGAVVAEVVDLSQIDVLCYAPPTAAARLKLGQKARLINETTTEDDPDQVLSGDVVYIGVQSVAETGNTAVKVRFANPGLKLRGGALVHVDVLTRDELPRDALAAAALMEDLEVPTVVALEDVKTENGARIGKVRKLSALVGVRDRKLGMVEVRLQDPATRESVDPAGLWFVTAGGQGLQDGDLARIEEK